MLALRQVLLSDSATGDFEEFGVLIHEHRSCTALGCANNHPWQVQANDLTYDCRG